MLGIIVTTIGIASLLFYALRKRGKHSDALWFGIFTALYGVRLLVDSRIFRLAIGMSDRSGAFFHAAISYILLPFVTLFLYSVFPRWRRVFNWILAAQIVLGLTGLICDQVFQVPFFLQTPNNVLVIIFFALLCFLVFRVERSFHIDALRAGVLFYSLTVLLANFGGLFKRDLSYEPLGFAVYLSCLAAVLVERSTRTSEKLTALEEELTIARRIQTSILPREAPQSAGLSIAARYLPMTSVAGDFYDFLVLDASRLGVLIADVTGHGVPAALIASMIKVASASQLQAAEQPALVMAGMNKTLCPNLQGQFVTAAYLFLNLDTKIFRYAAAAHPRMQWLHRNELRVEAVEENGLLIGVLPVVPYTAVEHTFCPGDRFLLHTDGLLEASDEHDEFFGEDRLRQTLLDSAALNPGDCADFILDKLAAWSGYGRGRPQEDDLTLIVVDVTGE